jgi:hypothetical protein
MDKEIQFIVDECKRGNNPTIGERELINVFEHNYNPMKETPREAMRNWIDRTESFLGIENAFILDNPERPPYYIFRAKVSGR